MRKIANEMKVRLPAVGENERLARAIVSAFCARADPTVEQLGDLRCAVSEAVTNAIVHAYRGREDRMECFIYISLRLYEDREVSVEVSDNGCGMEDVERARKPFYSTGDAQEERCGMGFLVMESFTDALSVKSKPGHGTSVLMRKKLNP